MNKIKIIIYSILAFICFVQMSCNGQKTTNEEHLKTEREKADYYSSKYFSLLKSFRKLVFEQYLRDINVTLLKTEGKCQVAAPIFYPVNFKVNLDSFLVHNIPFSEKVLFVSVIFFRKKMPENILWSSNMKNYCSAETDFIRANIDEHSIDGAYQIENGFSVGFMKCKQDTSEIIYLGTDGLLSDYPILLKIYLKKEGHSQ